MQAASGTVLLNLSAYLYLCVFICLSFANCRSLCPRSSLTYTTLTLSFELPVCDCSYPICLHASFPAFLSLSLSVCQGYYLPFPLPSSFLIYRPPVLPLRFSALINTADKTSFVPNRRTTHRRRATRGSFEVNSCYVSFFRVGASFRLLYYNDIEQSVWCTSEILVSQPYQRQSPLIEKIFSPFRQIRQNFASYYYTEVRKRLSKLML